MPQSLIDTARASLVTPAALLLAASASAQEFLPVAPMYHSREAVHAILGRWAEVDPGELRLHRFGDEPDQLVMGLELGRPGGGDLADRRVVWVLGGMDGLSLVGVEGALGVASHWLNHRSELPGDVSLLICPWASAGDLDATLRKGPHAAAADGMDLDGDGLVLEMLTEDPHGQWVRASDGRFLTPAIEGDAERLRHSVEGGQSAVGLARGLQSAFPGGSDFGDEVWVNTGSRLADALLARDSAAVVVLGGTGAAVGRPALCLPGDRESFAGLARGFGLRAGHGGVEASSSPFLEWCYTVGGLPAFELRLWQPAVPAVPRPADLGWSAERAPCSDDLRWASWLDEDLGGFGFVEWRAVDTGDGVRAWVGGWRERTRYNPPEAVLADVIAPAATFVGDLVQELPRLEIAVVEASRDRDLCKLVIEVRSHGRLPLAADCAGRWTGGDGSREPWLRLELPAGALCLAGPERAELPGLRGGGPVRVEWLVSAPEAASFVLTTGAPSAPTIERRLQP